MVKCRAAVALATLVASSVASSLACGDYARTNPYDPEADVTITITGPDTAWSLLETLHYTATVSPLARRGTTIVWDTDDVSQLPLRGEGTYQTQAPGNANVVVRVGRHEARYGVAIIQRPVSVFFRCATGNCRVLITRLGQERTVVVDQYDRLGTELQAGQPFATVSYVVRDPAVAEIIGGSASPQSVQVRALGEGSTYLVATMTGAEGVSTDSIPLIVDVP